MIKKKSKARGVKIIIENPEIQPRIAINTFRYSIQETVIRNGDSSCKPFKRHKGITSGAIMNKFGFTYYLMIENEEIQPSLSFWIAFLVA